MSKFGATAPFSFVSLGLGMTDPLYGRPYTIGLAESIRRQRLQTGIFCNVLLAHKVVLMLNSIFHVPFPIKHLQFPNLSCLTHQFGRLTYKENFTALKMFILKGQSSYERNNAVFQWQFSGLFPHKTCELLLTHQNEKILIMDFKNLL
ncbi:hypothetical protein ATANTOWER_013615 [Ataeniobius toweri]|uniref:Uncharacterized protein n=1 Tax=Ataeniobius toweri TaxID=208326 RepID=A0ABU7C2N8_9TELE|nr:hypothetical protein [Ataeniobius toweri]